MHAVSVIMPTRAIVERGALLRRALASVLEQRDICVVPLVIINGRDADHLLTRELHEDRRVRVAILEQADLPAALRAGRNLVDTPFFAELDDDDVLLPGALTSRVQALLESPECHSVVSNGFRRDSMGDRLHIPDISVLERDPLRALLRDNWLLPGSWLCRTEAIGASVFDGMPKFLECTYLAVRLALDGALRFLSQPTVIWHSDTPLSVSRSRDYVLGQPAALSQILDLELPPDVRAGIRTRMSGAYHAIASLHLNEGSFEEAWSWHLRSIREPGGWRHVSFSRHLLRASLRV
ncbi:MAG: glycosyltransferase family A protein [Gemmatimonadaceae bacterium]